MKIKPNFLTKYPQFFAFLLCLVIFLLLYTVPAYFIKAKTQSLTPEILNVSNEWVDSNINSISEIDNLYINETKHDTTLSVNFPKVTECSNEINSIILYASAYSKDENSKFIFDINGVKSTEIVPSHNINEFSIIEHSFTEKKEGTHWTCKDLENIVASVTTIDKVNPESEWRIDKLWINIEFQNRDPEINQRSYRWQYETNNVISKIKPDEILKQVQIGEILALRVQLDNTGDYEITDQKFTLLYSTPPSDINCKNSKYWNEVTNDSEIKFLEKSTDIPIKESKTNTEKTKNTLI